MKFDDTVEREHLSKAFLAQHNYLFNPLVYFVVGKWPL